MTRWNHFWLSIFNLLRIPLTFQTCLLKIHSLIKRGNRSYFILRKDFFFFLFYPWYLSALKFILYNLHVAMLLFHTWTESVTIAIINSSKSTPSNFYDNLMLYSISKFSKKYFTFQDSFNWLKEDLIIRVIDRRMTINTLIIVF